MDGGTLPEPGQLHRRRSLPQAGSDSPDGEDDSEDSRTPASRDRLRRPASRDALVPKNNRLEASFPLIFFGAGCLASAVFVVLSRSHESLGRIPLWVPFLALGIIALGGGILSLFAEPDESEAQPAPRPTVARPLPPRTPPRGRPRPSAVAPPPPAARISPPKTTRRVAPASPPPPEPVEPEPEPEPAVTSPAPSRSPSRTEIPLLGDDSAALLEEIDRISADLHSDRGILSPRGGTSSTPPRTTRSPARPVVLRSPAEDLRPRAAIPLAELAAPPSPRRVERCVACGSPILHAGSPIQCQVCQEPLCPDCRDRSLAEGRPNLCPLCALLNTVHSGPSVPSRPAGPGR